MKVTHTPVTLETFVRRLVDTLLEAFGTIVKGRIHLNVISISEDKAEVGDFNPLLQSQTPRLMGIVHLLDRGNAGNVGMNLINPLQFSNAEHRLKLPNRSASSRTAIRKKLQDELVVKKLQDLDVRHGALLIFLQISEDIRKREVIADVGLDNL